MATEFQSCPGCESFILADTFECPQCGHVFDEERSQANKASQNVDEIKNQQMYDTCRSCGESVRSGLVRCWSCNAFMRKDVEARYKEMTASPQPIIFSDIPKDKRTELIPERSDPSGQTFSTGIFDAEADDDEFTLRSSVVDDAAQRADDAAQRAELRAQQNATQNATPAQPTPQPPVDSKAEAPAKTEAKDTPDSKPSASTGKAAKPVPGEKKSADDDLFGLAIQDQRETKRKKRDKIMESRKKRILLPCIACGGWIRVHEEQGGKVVRCGQCKARLVVPMMKKKEKAADAASSAAVKKKIAVTWLNDLQMHIVTPTDVVLKPGSLAKNFEPVDVAFHESGMYLVKLAPPAKKSLFGKSSDGPPDIEAQRTQIRDQIAASGDFSSVPFGDIHAVPEPNVPKLRLIQPVAEAHSSMFAGVPVFGEGRIAIYLPLTLAENQQAILSLPLSVYRSVAEQLQALFKFSVGAENNGVPSADEYESLKCAVSDENFESLKGVEYYENDSAYELAVAGFVCATCGAAVSEEGRARKKLGGANGKGIAKAKCPKCSNKMGDKKAFKIAKAPGDEDPEAKDEEDVSDVLKPKPAAKAKAADTSTTVAKPSIESLQGRWKMLALGQNGDFANPVDMTAHNIVFEIEGDKYSVKAGDAVQEKGTLKIDNTQTPAHLDQQVSEGADSGKSHLGIFRLTDGKLENCQGAFDQPRPQGFESQTDSTASLAVFQRA